MRFFVVVKTSIEDKAMSRISWEYTKMTKMELKAILSTNLEHTRLWIYESPELGAAVTADMDCCDFKVLCVWDLFRAWVWFPSVVVFSYYNVAIGGGMDRGYGPPPLNFQNCGLRICHFLQKFLRGLAPHPFSVSKLYLNYTKRIIFAS